MQSQDATQEFLDPIDARDSPTVRVGSSSDSPGVAPSGAKVSNTLTVAPGKGLVVGAGWAVDAGGLTAAPQTAIVTRRMTATADAFVVMLVSLPSPMGCVGPTTILEACRIGDNQQEH